MQLHTLKRKTQRQTKQQVGRGSKRGKTSGRGQKGQTSRAGRKLRPEIREIIKKIPKLYRLNPKVWTNL
jgi:ribosomal protein L15